MLSEGEKVMIAEIANLLAIVASGVGAVTSLVAAYFWFRSSRVPPPIVLEGVAGYGGPVQVDTVPLLAFTAKSGRLNGIAALWSGVAASCFVVSSAMGLLVWFVAGD
jgi:hypothetical protein